MSVLSLHPLFGASSIQRAAGDGPMRTGAADDVRFLDHFYDLIGMLGQTVMDRRQIVDETGAISFSAESLETEQCVPAESND